MAYQLKSTGIAADCTMCIAVDPDTNTIKDFASSAVTADMTVGTGVTISAQTWDGNTRSYFKRAASDGEVAFGATKPNYNLNTNGMQRTVVWIGEAAGVGVRVIGKDSTNYFSSENHGSGGSSYPTVAGMGWTSSATAAQTRPSAGQKIIFGFSATHGTSATMYWALDNAASMSSTSVTTPTATGSGPNIDIAYVGRRNDTGNTQYDKIHAVLIFDVALTEAQFDSLRDDWFGTLLETASAGDPYRMPNVGSSVGSKSAIASAVAHHSRRFG